MRKAFDAVYSGTGMPYAFSYANEVVTKGICIFRMAEGNPGTRSSRPSIWKGYGLSGGRSRRVIGSA